MPLRTLNTILVDAPAALIFPLAAAVENWPRLLPHYRYVRVVGSFRPPEPGITRTVEMAAHRLHMPVYWVAEQTIDGAAMEIRYRHVGGVTLGMDVVWHLEPWGDMTLITIDHELESPRRWLRNPLSALVVGQGFVVPIADRTLLGIKRHAEAHRLAGVTV